MQSQKISPATPLSLLSSALLELVGPQEATTWLWIYCTPRLPRSPRNKMEIRFHSMIQLMKKRALFSKNILNWRKKNNFDYLYPWRNSKDNYKILLSEILLKKTTRKQVAKEWKKIVRGYPSFKALEKADLRKLKKILTPLGMERVRAKQLKQLAKKISNDFGGKVPSSKNELLTLPGVGPYTANAVLCFAFHHDVSMVDTNILRVVKRIFSITSHKARERTDKKIWQFIETLPPKGKGKVFNYAVLDFANEVCTARNPKCPTCPMKKICNYYKNNF